MALVVFMRAVNVGGHQKFRPAVLAKALARLDVTSLGAAGTFVVRAKLSRAALRKAVLAELAFEPEMMIVEGREVLALLKADPFASVKAGAEARPYVSVLAKKPAAPPRLPIEKPADRAWQVRCFSVQGCFALSLARRMPGTLVYPNEVVERALGVSATTRNWDTLASIGEALGR